MYAHMVSFIICFLNYIMIYQNYITICPYIKTYFFILLNNKLYMEILELMKYRLDESNLKKQDKELLTNKLCKMSKKIKK